MFLGALAFVADAGVLVRPEFALIGGLALIMMLIVARVPSPRRSCWLYDSCRWPTRSSDGDGLRYLSTARQMPRRRGRRAYPRRTNRPHAACAAGAPLIAVDDGALPAVVPVCAGTRLSRAWRCKVRRPVAFIAGSAAQALYWIRQGGDLCTAGVAGAAVCLLAWRGSFLFCCPTATFRRPVISRRLVLVIGIVIAGRQLPVTPPGHVSRAQVTGTRTLITRLPRLPATPCYQQHPGGARVITVGTRDLVPTR